VGVQEVRWDKGGAVRTDFFFYGKEHENQLLGIGMFVHHRIVLAVKRVEFFSDRMSYIYIVLRGRWCDVIVLNVKAPSVEKSDL